MSYISNRARNILNKMSDKLTSYRQLDIKPKYSYQFDITITERKNEIN